MATKKKRRVPRDESAFNEWYSTKFSPNLAAVAADVEVSAAKVARVANDSAVYSHLIERNNLVRVYKEAESAAKTRIFDGSVNDPAPKLPKLELPDLPAGLTLNCGIEEYAENLVQQIVKNQNCTAEIEALLGIELKGEAGNDDDLRGVIHEIKAMPGKVVLRCSMEGYKAYRVFSQRGADDNFQSIGDSMQAEFEDERPNLVSGQPEKRQYRIILLEKNKPVGEYSAIETVVTEP